MEWDFSGRFQKFAVRVCVSLDKELLKSATEIRQRTEDPHKKYASLLPVGACWIKGFSVKVNIHGQNDIARKSRTESAVTPVTGHNASPTAILKWHNSVPIQTALGSHCWPDNPERLPGYWQCWAVESLPAWHVTKTEALELLPGKNSAPTLASASFPGHLSSCQLATVLLQGGSSILTACGAPNCYPSPTIASSQ